MSDETEPRSPVVIRTATAGDVPAVAGIRNDAVENSTALWTHQRIDPDAVSAWVTRGDDSVSAGQASPFIVAEVDGQVVGYAIYSGWRPYSGFRRTVDDSIYISDGYHGRGIGFALLDELVARARAAGFHVMIADIEGANLASIALHRRLGFEVTGTIREVGTKFDQWFDLTIMALRLNEGGAPEHIPAV